MVVYDYDPRIWEMEVGGKDQTSLSCIVNSRLAWATWDLSLRIWVALFLPGFRWIFFSFSPFCMKCIGFLDKSFIVLRYICSFWTYFLHRLLSCSNVKFCQMLFLYLVKWSCDFFFTWFYLYTISHVIGVGWHPWHPWHTLKPIYDHGMWSIQMCYWIHLKMFYWGLLHLFIEYIGL